MWTNQVIEIKTKSDWPKWLYQYPAIDQIVSKDKNLGSEIQKYYSEFYESPESSILSELIQDKTEKEKIWTRLNDSMDEIRNIQKSYQLVLEDLDSLVSKDCRIWMIIISSREIKFGFSIVCVNPYNPKLGLQIRCIQISPLARYAGIVAFDPLEAWRRALAGDVSDDKDVIKPEKLFIETMLIAAQQLASVQKTPFIFVNADNQTKNLLSNINLSEIAIKIPLIPPICGQSPGKTKFSYVFLAKQQINTISDFWTFYTLVRHLGGGVFGDVYEIKNLQTGERFALKLAKPEKLNTALRELDVFHEAAQACPFVIQYYGAGMIPWPQGNIDNYQLGIVMEYINGKSLREVFQDSTMSISDFKNYFVQFLNQLDCLGKHGIYHQDLHGMNMMIDRSQQRLWIVDFGLSCSDNLSARIYTYEAVCQAMRYDATSSRSLGKKDLIQGVEEFISSRNFFNRLRQEDAELANLLDQISDGNFQNATEVLALLK